MKVERTRRQFTSNDRNFYDNYYFDKSGTRDTTTAFSIKNTFAIALLEGFNRYAKAGLTAYISHKYSHYDLMDSLSLNRTNQYKPTRYKEQEVFVGGELAKRQGNLLHYNINGEVGIAAEAIGEFRLKGDADLNFRLFKDTVNL